MYCTMPDGKVVLSKKVSDTKTINRTYTAKKLELELPHPPTNTLVNADGMTTVFQL